MATTTKSKTPKRKPGTSPALDKHGNPTGKVMGRPVGSRNQPRRQLAQYLKARFGEDWDPVIEMAEQAVELVKEANKYKKSEMRETAIAALDKVAKYVTPTLKAVEVDLSSSDGTMTPPRVIALVPARSPEEALKDVEGASMPALEETENSAQIGIEEALRDEEDEA